jgi:hypothetical protein
LDDEEECELAISKLMSARGIHCVTAREMPSRETRMEVGRKEVLRRVQKTRMEESRWERVQVRGRVSPGMRKRERGLVLVGEAGTESVNWGRMRLVRRETMAKRIMMNVAWRMEWGEGERGAGVGKEKVVVFLAMDWCSVWSGIC